MAGTPADADHRMIPDDVAETDATALAGDSGLAANTGRSRSRMGPARKAALVAGVPLLFLLALFAWKVVNGDQVEGAFAPSPLDGKRAPAIDGSTIDGAPYSLDNDRGSWVVVNFFATWCPPCLKEHPELIEFEQRHAAGGERRVVSMVFGGPEEAASARAFFSRNGGTWPVVIDPTGIVAVDYAVAKVPESILVAPSGFVYGKIRGGVTADALDAIIDEAESLGGGS